MNTKDFYPTNFNPSDWLKSENKASSAAAPSSSGVASPTSREDDAARVKALIEALQASHVDLTASYDNWLHVGFALANTFGENGRTFFHEISALSPKYDRKEADSKYSSCLRQGNGTVTIGTLFHLAKEHAVTWSHPLPLRPLRPMRPVSCAAYACVSSQVRVCVQPCVSTSLMCVPSCEVRRLSWMVRFAREGWGRFSVSALAVCL